MKTTLKITKTFTVLFSVVSLFLLIYTTMFKMYSIKKNYVYEQQSTAILVMDRISELRKKIDIATTSLVHDKEVAKILYELSQEGIDSERKHELETILTNKLHVLMYYLPYATNISLVNKEKEYFSYVGLMVTQNKPILSSTNFQSYYNQVIEELPINELHVFMPSETYWYNQDRKVLPVRYKISSYNRMVESLLMLDLSYDMIISDLDEATVGNIQGITVLKESGQPIIETQSFSNEERKDMLQVNTLFKNQLFYQKIPIDNSTSVLIVKSDTELLKKQIFRKTIEMIILLFLMNALTYLTIKSISKKMMTPLQKLMLIAQNEQIIYSEEEKNEFEYLGRIFHSMKLKQTEMEKEVLESQVKEKTSELKALQAKINPHFLYNVLNSIGAAANIYGPEVASEMSQKLANMMRYILSDQTEVALIEELNNAEDYLKIMNIMYGSNLIIDIEENIQDHTWRVPKLVIQPLLENAFKHGLKKKKFPWKIDVSMKSDEHGFLIIVKDNGEGFSHDLILNQHYVSKGNDKNIGLNNIIKRMTLKYGKQFDIQFTSSCEGSIIQMKVRK